MHCLRLGLLLGLRRREVNTHRAIGATDLAQEVLVANLVEEQHVIFSLIAPVRVSGHQKMNFLLPRRNVQHILSRYYWR